MQIMVGKILGQMGGPAHAGGVRRGASRAHLLRPRPEYRPDEHPVLRGLLRAIAFFLIARMMSAIGSAVSEFASADAHDARHARADHPDGPVDADPATPTASRAGLLVRPARQPVRDGAASRAASQCPSGRSPSRWPSGSCRFVAAWAASKIFRIGVLMYGKPPNLRTLLSGSGRVSQKSVTESRSRPPLKSSAGLLHAAGIERSDLDHHRHAVAATQAQARDAALCRRCGGAGG